MYPPILPPVIPTYITGDIDKMLDLINKLKKIIDESKPTIDRLKKLEKYANDEKVNNSSVRDLFLWAMSDDEKFDSEIKKV